MMHDEAMLKIAVGFFMGTSVLLEVITTNQKYWLMLVMNSASVSCSGLSLFFSICG
jgi:hypothetical protein